jgi:hypothetical protein
LTLPENNEAGQATPDISKQQEPIKE